MKASDLAARILVLVENLSKVFETPHGKVEAVKKVNLEVKKGEFVSIIGPTGSGKTTLLNLIGGLTFPTEGFVFIDGCYLGNLRDEEISRFRGEKIGFIFQFASLIPSLTVLENVCLPSFLLRKGPKEAVLTRAKMLIERVGLSEKEASLPSCLSGGEQRLVAIARSLINQPELILADEPTGDLDEKTEVKVIDLLHQLNREEKITFILVTHNSKLAAKSDQLFKMRGGKLIRKE